MNENDDNIYYCSNCLSLAIVTDSGIDYCRECGCSVIKEDTIENWENLYKEKYPKKNILHSRGIFINNYKKNEYYTK